MVTANETYQPMTDALSGTVLKPVRILVSDSDVLIREIISRKLSRIGYICECCDTSRDALDILAGESYDLLLTAFSSPENGGANFLKRILEICPNIAVILITSVVDIDVAVDALKLGAYDYITKPFSVEEVSKSVSRALEKRRLLLENSNYRRTLETLVASRTRQLKEALGVLEQTYHSTLVALSKALDSRDADSDGNTLRVTLYASRLAKEMGVSKSRIKILEQGILMHDVGNIGIPDALLKKRESLDEEELCLMRKHPEIGCRILSRVKFLKEPAQLVLQHHERYDGTGYPKGLQGEEISLGARIFAVVDAFDSLISPKFSFTVTDYKFACEEIKKMSGAELDPVVVYRFLDIPFGEWKEICREAEMGNESAKGR